MTPWASVLIIWNCILGQQNTHLDLYCAALLCPQKDIGLSQVKRLPDVNSLIERYCPFNSTNHLCSNPFSLSGLSPWWRQMEGPPANPDSHVPSACSREPSAKVNRNTRHHRTMSASQRGCASSLHLTKHKEQLQSMSKDVGLYNRGRQYS